MSTGAPTSPGLVKQGRVVLSFFAFVFLIFLVHSGYVVDVAWSGARILLTPPKALESSVK